MTMDRSTRADRVLAGLFDELADARTPDYLEAAIERASSRPQRPAWTFPERWLPMADITQERAYTPRAPWRMIAVALLALALIVGALLVAGSQQRRLPAPFGPAANGLIPFEANGDLFVGDPVAGTSQLLVGGPGVDVDPTFSPDGTRVIFGRETAAGIDLYVVDEDGSNVRRLSDAPLIEPGTGTWAPDSSTYVQTHRLDGAWVIDAFDATGGSAPVRLDVAGLTDVDALAFRPTTGDEILFRGLVDNVWGLYTMQPDGTGVTRLTAAKVAGFPDQDLNFATYTPDGARILFNRYEPTAGMIQLWVMNADGTDQRVFSHDPDAIWEGEPSVSPDGRLVAMWRVYDEASPRISIIRSDGVGPAIQTGPVIPETAHYAWAPDSSALLMIRNSGDGRRQLLLDPTGGPWTTPAWDSASEPDWQRKAD
jgi:Tol biopolymer transport system component